MNLSSSRTLRHGAGAMCVGAVLTFASMLPGVAAARDQQPVGSPTLAAVDQKFVEVATQSSSTEIDTAKLALKQSSDKDVKSFARHMIVDHTKLTVQLKAAAPKGVKVPKDNTDGAVMQALQGLKGKAFDDAYVKQVGLDGHRKAVAAFREEADNGTNADLKRAAQKALPTIEGHLKMAEDLAAKKGIAP